MHIWRQDQISKHIGFLEKTLSKVKSSKQVEEAVKDLKDLIAFHQYFCIPRYSLFIQPGKFVLLHPESYLEHLKQWIKLIPGTSLGMPRSLVRAPSRMPFSTLLNRTFIKQENQPCAPAPGPDDQKEVNHPAIPPLCFSVHVDSSQVEVMAKVVVAALLFIFQHRPTGGKVF